MKVSIVALLQDNNIANFSTAMELFKKQHIGYENLELIIMDQTTTKTEIETIEVAKAAQEENVRIVREGKVDFAALKGSYVNFFDFNYEIGNGFYNTLYDLCEKEQLDFASANMTADIDKDLSNSAHVVELGFDGIVSMKLIKKDLLLQKGFSFLNDVNAKTIEFLQFKLYLVPLKFKYTNRVRYHHYFDFNEEYIKDSVKNVSYTIKQSIELNNQDMYKDISMIELQHLMYLIDKNTFTNNLMEEEQSIAYGAVRELLKIFNSEELKANDLGGYLPFFNLLKKELDEEATHYIKLLRSKRHWYQQSNKYEQYFEKNPHSLEDSLSWKVTRPLRKAKKMSRSVKSLFHKIFLIMLASIVKLFLFNKKVWLVGEREDQAEDNGYFFFKHCRENHPNQKVYYVINEDSPHLHKVEKYGNVIYHSSFKHRLYMLVADTYISAWTFEECSYPRAKKEFIKLFGKQIANKKNICLQHGVIIHNISPYLHKERYNQDLIISSSEYEKKIIQNTLGYSDEQVAITGLARFDNLHNLSVKKQILIMPTWRRHLFKINKHSFLKSEYFKAYNNLIRNKEFLEAIEKHNIPVKFYIHSQMQKFMDNFVFEHPNIEFLVKSTATVSELLKESALLVTDYSSVSSDFLYMNKPVIMYQFDPHNNHHAPVKEIEYRDLGMIASNEDQLISNVLKTIDQEFKTNKHYIKNSKRIFKYKDQHNCERIYNVILEKTS
ncbi:CDP-glycerol glycerophosphotransferase family protein [Priestia sp. GS2]|uniref:CDP-glycerol glycerophosphotransferase family protein n=1 Tax=Priestia sp. GS2 TaxID=3117403 RepID=UPI002ED773D4